MLIAFFYPGFALAATVPAAPPAPASVQACFDCHGAGGNSATTGVPSIAGQPKIYLENTLVLTREGLRGNPAMQGLMKGLKDPEIIAIARHVVALLVHYEAGPADKALARHGREVAAKLRCASCHGANFRGREQMPRLAGQREEFLDARMRTLRDKPPPGTDTIMSATLYGVSNADIQALAHFLAHLR